LLQANCIINCYCAIQDYVRICLVSSLIRQTKAWNRKMSRKLRRRDLRSSKCIHGHYDPLKNFSLFTCTLKIQAAHSSKMSLTIYQSTCLCMTEDMNLQSSRNYPFQKRNSLQLKCFNYTCLLESLCFSQDFRPIAVQKVSPCPFLKLAYLYIACVIISSMAFWCILN
jgi:hypothetical protein